MFNHCHYVFVDDRYGRAIAAAGNSISFTLRNIPPGTSLMELRQEKFKVSYERQETHIATTIIATWCVGSPLRESASSKAAMTDSPLYYLPLISAMAKGSSRPDGTSTEAPRPRPRMLQRFFTNSPEESSSVFPGDICSPVSSIRDGDHPSETPKICGLIISRCVKKYRGMAPQLVIWIRMMEDGNTGTPYTVIGLQAVAEPLKLVCQRKGTSPSPRPYPSQFGTLQDDRQYVVYRMLLYCDDFKSSESLYSQTFCGRVYFLPIGLTQRSRRSRTAVHVISLTPPGVSTKEVLLRIIPDIVKGTKGIDGVLPSGEPVVIFLDVVGFVADYPAAAEPLDILGHTADTPCTHCTIRKLKNNGSSTMGFAPKLHSSFSPTLRCAERHEALCESDLTARENNVLGMKPAENATTQEHPLAMPREHLLAARPSIPRTIDNIPVITGLFGPFRSSIIPPDHLLSGVARNAMDLFFHILPPGDRKDLNIAICAALVQNGLPRHQTVQNERKIQLHTMSLSSVFSVLLVSQPICMGFNLPRHGVIRDIQNLVSQLKDLIAMTYWIPSVATDGREAFDLMRMDEGREYYRFLQGLAERYVTGVDKFCAHHPDLCAMSDKPNLHRLLELYQHSIPAFGHVSLFQKTVFETAHQPLKRSVARGNHRHAEAYAVEQCLGNDWQARIGSFVS